MPHKFNRPQIAKKFVYPTDAEFLDYLDGIRLWAEEVCRDLKETPGGDAIEYRGSMNNVELLRKAIDDYHGLSYRVKR